MSIARTAEYQPAGGCQQGACDRRALPLRPDDSSALEVNCIDATEITVVTGLGPSPQVHVLATGGDSGRVAFDPAVIHAVIGDERHVEITGTGVNRGRRPAARTRRRGADQIGSTRLRLKRRIDDLLPAL